MVRYLISIGKGKKEGKMLFDVYGANAGFQWLGLFMVLGALILLNEFADAPRQAASSCSLEYVRR